jgi:hypothetical protein
MDSIESSNQAVDVIYKAKAAKFNGRDVVIILQDDNCGSPLVAICESFSILTIRNLNKWVTFVSKCFWSEVCHVLICVAC